jgi:hypothetical protein
VPSWQTTVVPECCGTTTVVVFSGGGGLLLLMHPANRQAAIKKLDTIFIVYSWSARDRPLHIGQIILVRLRSRRQGSRAHEPVRRVLHIPVMSSA